MTNKRFLVVLLAVLTALILCACGDTVEVSSEPEGIDTFGYVNPSAQPSMADTVPGQDNPPADPSQDAPVPSTGLVIEGDTPTSIQPSSNPGTDTPVSAAPTSTSGNGSSSGATAAPTATRTPSNPATSPATSSTPGSQTNPGSSDAPVTSDEPVSSPAIAPPEPASTATISDASSYVGQSLSSLIAELGYPYSSDYEDVDEEDPDTDRVGTLYFDGFIVTTLRTADSETVTSVVAN